MTITGCILLYQCIFNFVVNYRANRFHFVSFFFIIIIFHYIILSRTHSTGYENVNCRGISSPPEGIGDGLQYNDFTLPVIFLFFFFIFDEKVDVDIPPNFSRVVTHSFRSIKIFLFCFYRTSIWINCNRTCLVSISILTFSFTFAFDFIYLVPT